MKTPQLFLLAVLFSAGYWMPPASAQTGEAEAQEVSFDVWEYQVSGNSVLERQQVERAVYPYLGPGRTVEDVEGARQALETLYRDAGFGTVVVNIPEQDVEEGMVRLEVVEGTVDRLLVSGATYFSPDRIKQKTPSLAEGEVPHLPQVQQELTRLNAASSDRQITPVLRAGRYPGTVEVDLRVQDKLPLHGSVEVNDQYTRDTTKTRINANLSYGNLWQRQHSIGLGYQTAPENRDDVTVWFGTYSAPIASSKWLFSGYYVDSDTDVATIGTLGVIGKGEIVGLRLIRPLPRWGEGFQSLTFGFDHKDFDENIALEGNQPSIETPIRYGIVNATWSLSFPGRERNTELTLGGVMGSRLLGNEADEFTNKRAGSKPSFAYLNLGLVHNRTLWLDTVLRMSMAAQLADSPLISNEQFSVGGAFSVRGYLESQQFVDDGYSGQFELLTPDLGRMARDWSSLRLLAFVDAGGGRLQDPLPEQDDDFLLWSAGLGLRAALWRRFTAALDWAYPFEDASDDTVLRGDDRWHFNVRFAF